MEEPFQPIWSRLIISRKNNQIHNVPLESDDNRHVPLRKMYFAFL